MIDVVPQPNGSQEQLQSFRPYSGKAPLLIRIVGGLLWLGAAGLLVFGALNLLVNVVGGITLIVLGIFVIVTAKSLFAMKKAAFRNALILAVPLAIATGWQLFKAGVNSNQSEYFSLVYVVLLAFIAFKYRGQFVN